MIKLVLIRHGQSLWNLENRFTGWTDVDLSENGLSEAREAGAILKKNRYTFDLSNDNIFSLSYFSRIALRDQKRLFSNMDYLNLQ